MSEPGRRPDDVAEAVRAACLEAARRAWEEAGISGLCAEGRWEVALDAVRGLDLEAVLAEIEAELRR